MHGKDKADVKIFSEIFVHFIDNVTTCKNVYVKRIE